MTSSWSWGWKSIINKTLPELYNDINDFTDYRNHPPFFANLVREMITYRPPPSVRVIPQCQYHQQKPSQRTARELSDNIAFFNSLNHH